MSKKGMKVTLSKDKLLGLKSVDLDFCEDCIYRKQKRVSFSMVRKTLKAEKLELVRTDSGVRLKFPPTEVHCIL